MSKHVTLHETEELSTFRFRSHTEAMGSNYTLENFKHLSKIDSGTFSSN
jgi:hypothetical protein